MDSRDQKMTVLLVDDEYFATSYYAEALTAQGFDVVLAPSVPAALELLNERRFDLAVVDLMMAANGVFDEKTTAGGFRTGIAVAELVEQRWPQTRLMVLTASCDTRAEEWFRRKRIPYFHKSSSLPYEFAQALWQTMTANDELGESRQHAHPDGTLAMKTPQTLRPSTERAKVRVRSVKPRERRPVNPSSTQSPDVLVLTAADIEYETIIDLAGIRKSLRTRRRAAAGRTFLDLGLRNCSAWAFQCKKGSVGPGSSLDVLKDAINALNPKPFAVINTGIAFGLKPTKQDMGDVLVSEQVRLYEIERRGTVRLARGDKVSSSSLLLSWFRDFKTDWATDTLSHRRPNIHFGTILSGEKLADDEALVSDLLRIEPEAIGGEMEAAGVYAAAAGEHLQHVHWIVVKGICDWGIGKGDKHQSIAARNAIDFVLHVLDQPAVELALADLRGADPVIEGRDDAKRGASRRTPTERKSAERSAPKRDSRI